MRDDVDVEQCDLTTFLRPDGKNEKRESGRQSKTINIREMIVSVTR